MSAHLLGNVQLSVTPWVVAHQSPLSVEFSRQEYRSGLPFLSPRDLPDPGIERTSPSLTGGFITMSYLGGQDSYEQLRTVNCNKELVLPQALCQLLVVDAPFPHTGMYNQ